MMREFMMRLMLAYFTRQPAMFFYPELANLAFHLMRRVRDEVKRND